MVDVLANVVYTLLPLDICRFNGMTTAGMVGDISASRLKRVNTLANLRQDSNGLYTCTPCYVF